MKKVALISLAAVMAMSVLSGSVLAMGDAEMAVDPKMAKKGKKVAIKQCFACHDITENKQIRVGPPLWGVYGQPAASVEGYEYSEAQISKKDSIVWDEATLDTYLQDPKSLVPGNKMAYPVAGQKVMTDKQRKNVIEFLKTLK